MTMLMLEFAVCDQCGCSLGMDALEDVSHRPGGWVFVTVECHCGLVSLRGTTLLDWLGFVAGAGALMAAWLDDSPAEALFEYWEDQALIEPDRIPVESGV